MLFKTIACICLVLIGCWQIYSTNRYFKFLRTKGNAATSSYAPMTVCSSYLMGAVLIGLAFSIFSLF